MSIARGIIELSEINDGKDAYSFTLSKESATISYDANGNALNGELGVTGKARTEVFVLRGNTPLTLADPNRTPTNLLLRSNVPATGSGYPFAQYKWGKSPINGATYTLVYNGRYNGVSTGYLSVYSNAGMQNVSELRTPIDTTKKVTFKFTDNAGWVVCFYNMPNGNNGVCTVNWAAIYEGYTAPDEWEPHPSDPVARKGEYKILSANVISGTASVSVLNNVIYTNSLTSDTAVVRISINAEGVDLYRDFSLQKLSIKQQVDATKTIFDSEFKRLDGLISTRASADAYNALGERVKKAESSIQQTPDAINLAVKKITVGTRNYIPASKFNTQESVAQVKGWAVRTWGLANDAIKGNVLKVDADGCFLPFTNKGFSVGDEVTLLFSIRADSNYSMFFQICNADGANKWSDGNISLTTEWQKIFIVIKVPPKITIESSQVIYFYPKIPCYIEYVTLNKSNVPAAWQPADEDADSQYSLIRQEFNSINLSTNEKVDGQNKVLASFGLTGENIEAKAKNFGLDKEGNVHFAGEVDAKSGSIGGFELTEGRIGCGREIKQVSNKQDAEFQNLNPDGRPEFGNLAIFKDFFSVGNPAGHVMFGADTMPASLGGGIKSVGRVYSKSSPGGYFNRRNYGLIFDVSGADYNYAASSNAPFFAPAFVSNRLQHITIGTGSYRMDISLYTMFNLIPIRDTGMILPTRDQIMSSFNVSTLPDDFALNIKLIHTTRVNYKITVVGLVNSSGGVESVDLWAGGSLNLVGTNENGWMWRIA